MPAWNQDHSLASGMQVSAVWFYQEMARRAGHDALQEAVRDAGYGNATISPPDSLTTFWLTGPLAISPLEQLAFLERLRMGTLPFSDSVQAAVRGIAVDETGPGTTLWGKSGWSTADTPGVGWYVGWTERDGAPYVFALQLAVRSPEDVPLRRALALQILRRLERRPPEAAGS